MKHEISVNTLDCNSAGQWVAAGVCNKRRFTWTQGLKVNVSPPINQITPVSLGRGEKAAITSFCNTLIDQKKGFTAQYPMERTPQKPVAKPKKSGRNS